MEFILICLCKKANLKPVIFLSLQKILNMKKNHIVITLSFAVIFQIASAQQWATNGANIYNSNTGGKVGIGTSTPGGLLQVSDGANDATKYGSLQIVRPAVPPDNLFHLSFIRASNAVVGMGFQNNSNNFSIWYQNDNSNIATPLMNFAVNNTVGIGTSDTKGYKLGVNGSAIFTKAVVRLYNNWPDYVFDKNYKPIPLRELENYILQYGHLPEMPSAEEMQKQDGIDLGDMNTKLLKKVEELTLYVIQLQKENDEIKERLKKLEEN